MNMRSYVTIPCVTLILLRFCSASNNSTIAEANNSSEPGVHLTALYGSTTLPNPSVVPDVVITVVVIGCCGLLGLGFAKLGDYLYDRRMATRDDISNASEYTKNILRARLAVMKMKTDPPSEESRTVKRAASAWIENTVNSSNKNRNTSGDDQAGTETDVKKADATSIQEAEQTDVHSENLETQPTTAPPTTNLAPHPSPLPNNKVSPSSAGAAKAIPMPTSTSDLNSLPASARGNSLPPISPRPEAPTTKSINQPIRSTRN